MDNILNLIIGTVASVLAAVIGYYFRKFIVEKRKIGKLNKMIFELGHTFYDSGISKFHFTRDDYGRTLASFLDTAKTSITIVSISLKITDEEGQLTNLFKRKLHGNQNFKIEISLINPNNDSLLQVAADTLNVSKERLKSEITTMLKDLHECNKHLGDSEKSRFKILVHDCFPMGSVVMLDTSPNGGMIQVETKLYRAPRTESFGFQVTKESIFYKNNLTAWNRIIADSKPFNITDITT
jgi:hypothetical protein